MKDWTHHRQHVQKKVIHDVRRENNQEINHYGSSPAPQRFQESSMAESQDSKRKATRDFVRRMNNRNH